SSIRTHPSLAHPSHILFLSTALSNLLKGISSFFPVPTLSVNCKRINWTFSSLIFFIISSLVKPDLIIFLLDLLIRHVHCCIRYCHLLNSFNQCDLNMFVCQPALDKGR